MPKAVFLDRDGVINRAIVRDGKPYPPVSIAEIEILSNVLEALTALHIAGYMLIVVTNQPDVARGKLSKETVERIHEHIANILPIDEFYTCYHDDKDLCNCRKPLPGLLINAANKFGIDFEKSYMIGDRWRDIGAGQNAGCKTIFIDYCYNERRPDSFDYRVASLAEAANIILEAENEHDRKI